ISGSGWKPNENVYLYAVDTQTEAWTYGSTVAADANGGFVVNPYFIVQMAQAGVNFSVTALGAQSAMQADVKFTDSKPNTVTVGPPNSLSVTPGGTANYAITVNFNGNSNSCTSPLSISGGLPAGILPADVVFTPTSVTSTGGNVPATLAITTHAGTLPGSYTFTVLAANGGGTCQSGTATGTGVLVVAGPATHFSVTGFPSPTLAGVAHNFTVTALDSNNNTAVGYTGTVTFSSSDAQAVFVPASYTFVAADNGVHTNGGTRKTVGTQSITATQGAITGTQSGIVVNAGTATQVRVETAADGSGTVVPAQNVPAGNPLTVYSISRDAANNFVDNVAADSWSLVSITGGVVAGDLNPGNKSAVFTGHVAGTAAIHASAGALTSTDSGTLTVVGGTAATKLVFTTSP